MILGFLLTALYVPGISGAATTPRWALLAIALPLLLWNKPNKLTIIHLLGLMFVAWSALSLLWTSNQLDGIGELIKVMILAQVFAYGSVLDDIIPIFLGMASGLLLSSAIAVAEIAWPGIVLTTTVAPSGLFINSGSLAEIAALVLIGLVYDRRNGVPSDAGRMSWCHLRYDLLGLGLLPCIVLPQSRGAWFALVAAGIAWVWSKSKLSALALLTLGSALIVYSLHIGFHVESAVQRLGMWSDAINGMDWRGHGIGSFWTDYAPLSNTLDIFIQRPEHLHNDWLEIVFEGGTIGIVLVAAMGIAACLGRGRRSCLGVVVLAGFTAEAAVGFPLHNPCTAFVAALCLGHLARDRDSIRDLLHAGRIRFGAGRTANRSDAEGYIAAQ